MKKPCYMLSTLLLINLLQGCGAREIEKKAFVIGVGIDEKKSGDDSSQPVMNGTFQVAVPRSLKPESTNEKAYQNFEDEGHDISEQISNIAQYSNKELYFAHNQIILISDQVAKHPERMERLLDFFVRHEDIRRSVRVFITKGNTKRYLNVENNEKLPAIYMDTLAANVQNHSRTASIKRLGDLQEDLLAHRSFVLPVMHYKNTEEIKLGGAAIIKGESSRLTHVLNEKDTEAMNILNGEFQNGMLFFELDDDLYIYKIDKSKSKIKLVPTKNGQLTFRITISVEGEIQEVNKQMDTRTISADHVKKEVEKQIAKKTEPFIKKLQNQYKTDVLGLGVYMEKHHHKEWLKLKKNWETGKNHFSQVKINTHIHTTISSAGGLR
ncbi:Ger(x)C family spore germination protein [Fictibacillus norfolkensis]|uniref:Ger(X)C family spore germination protein n=1 Tax=Fictibacillus norfolkensis TaxID=2762233 RepID=A0ABR8SI12_9BACL|nr:Ger(x)C family spore germination protein [Fictibacillus norfolkensis]MBD7963028.1 Ger(x)C family spore germination protein [Fictibacillus norfolkensis]